MDQLSAMVMSSIECALSEPPASGSVITMLPSSQSLQKVLCFLGNSARPWQESRKSTFLHIFDTAFAESIFVSFFLACRLIERERERERERQREEDRAKEYDIKTRAYVGALCECSVFS